MVFVREKEPYKPLHHLCFNIMGLICPIYIKDARKQIAYISENNKESGERI